MVALVLVAGVGRMLFRATTRGEDPTAWIVAFVACLGVAIIANVGLRVRLFGDRAGIRLAREFLPWYEVTALDPADAGHRVTARLTGSRSVALPPATSSRDLSGLAGLGEDAARFGVGRQPHPDVSPLRSLPMDRDPLPSGVARAVGSIAIALLAVGATLWPLLPRAAPPTAIAPIPRFSDHAFRPVWTRYIRTADQTWPAATARGVVLVERVPVEGPAFRRIQVSRMSLITPSGTTAWRRTYPFGLSLRMFAAGRDGVLVLSDQARVRYGQPGCCVLTLLDYRGRIAWTHNAYIGAASQIVVSGDGFLILSREPGVQGRRDRTLVHVVDPTGGVTRWHRTLPSRAPIWGTGRGLAIATTRGRLLDASKVSTLTRLDAGGNVLSRERFPGSVQDFARTERGYVVGTVEVEGASISTRRRTTTLWGVRGGDVIWMTPVSGVGYPQLVTDRGRLYTSTNTLGAGGPTTTLRRIDSHSGRVVARWQVATIRVEPSMMMAGGRAYLLSRFAPPFSLQRLEWPAQAVPPHARLRLPGVPASPTEGAARDVPGAEANEISTLPDGSMSVADLDAAL